MADKRMMTSAYANKMLKKLNEDKEFWRSALQTVAQQIDLVCGLLEEGKQ